jgi:hypothetical protein
MSDMSKALQRVVWGSNPSRAVVEAHHRDGPVWTGDRLHSKPSKREAFSGATIPNVLCAAWTELWVAQ